MFRTCAIVLALAVTLGGVVRAQSAGVWFTVTGHQDDPAVDTVQVDPLPIDAKGDQRVMRIRVSRATERRNWEGVPYRSYVARVLIDCKERKARYLQGEFHLQPLWRGTPHTITDYSKPPVRQMLFLDAQPNPTQRIIRAACGG
ncbi:hypothetical protein FN976_22460 [Caenimonas sedimenti]|uniref:Surface-adhesin protein E-like domain-containing protein n=1 Tax=Caenimonas sedimenti TaxID=2596921 RepID=A0A562ZJ14_9BURK|nr:surface-adhesin E family protein [Caenimonas sedimenti]TWO68401.1 hypothetical protein FN976_22460 [Caenimonas sedimenti]